MKMRELVQQKKGKHFYDKEEDILYIKVDDVFYDHSIEFDELIVDFNKKGKLSGVQLFDASEIFRLDKDAIEKIKECELITKIENNIVSVNIHLTAFNGKGEITHTHDFVRESPYPLEDMEVHAMV